MRQFLVLVSLAIIALTMTACGGGNAGRTATPVLAFSSTTSQPPISAPSRLGVTEHDFALSLDSGAAGSGAVTFAIYNTGPSSHELLAFRTDLPDDKLPTGSDGRVNEDALKKVLDTGTDVLSGTQRQVVTNLPAGRYVLICFSESLPIL